MKIKDFTYLLEDPNSISKGQTLDLEDIINKFPYFQGARVLHLKGLKKQSSFKYNDALKTTAAYTTNRTVLFDFITKDVVDVIKTEEREKAIIQNSEIVDLELVNESNTEEDLQLKEEKTEITKTEVLEDLSIGKPLEFDKNEKHSFNEWLKLTKLKPIDRSKKLSSFDTTKTKKVNTIELIDNFLQRKPKIEPVKSSKSIDISGNSSVENESLMTETLARVYLEQKKYDQAIKAFKILSLKYPEKSGFFADRIRAVEFLKENNS